MQRLSVPNKKGANQAMDNDVKRRPTTRKVGYVPENDDTHGSPDEQSDANDSSEDTDTGVDDSQEHGDYEEGTANAGDSA
jgi:hypothetical protein